jgi:hypothetical protein
MPSQGNVTPHRVLPFVLMIPLLLLLVSVRMAGTGGHAVVFSGNGASGLSHRLPIPIPWEDDGMATGLPVPEQDGKRTVRKIPRVRVEAPDKPLVAFKGFRPGPGVFPLPTLDSLTISLILSRPPPAASPFGGNGAAMETTASNTIIPEEETS